MCPLQQFRSRASKVNVRASPLTFHFCLLTALRLMPTEEIEVLAAAMELRTVPSGTPIWTQVTLIPTCL